MTKFQWKLIKALCILVKALIEGEKFDSLEARVQYKDELRILDDTINRNQVGLL